MKQNGRVGKVRDLNFYAVNQRPANEPTLTGRVPTGCASTRSKAGLLYYMGADATLEAVQKRSGHMDYLKALKVCQEALEGYSSDCIGSDPRAQQELDRAWHIVRKEPSFFRLTIHWPQGPEEYFFTSKRSAELHLLELQDSTGIKISRDEYDITPVKVNA